MAKEKPHDVGCYLGNQSEAAVPGLAAGHDFQTTSWPPEGNFQNEVTGYACISMAPRALGCTLLSTVTSK